MHSFAGIIESSNFARKSMPIMGVAVAVGGGGGGTRLALGCCNYDAATV